MDYGKTARRWLAFTTPGFPWQATRQGHSERPPGDEWGIRHGRLPSVRLLIERGGDTNGPAEVYSITKYLEWLPEVRTPQAQGMTFGEAGPLPAQGAIAQQIFWYTAFTADMVKPGLPVVNADGSPKWRMAPSPKGAYWKEGMKLGYQDAGSWTLLKSTPVDRRKAAWLYAQFVNSKSVSLKKSHVGLTFTRESDIWDKSFTERAPAGGLIEFFAHTARVQWTQPAQRAELPEARTAWWQNIVTHHRAQMSLRRNGRACGSPGRCPDPS